ncbi:MAG: Bax inhibitor-1/YccA family protein [Candidatus Nanopelagicales bacterium]
MPAMQSRNPVLRHATEQAKSDAGAGEGALAAEGRAAYDAASHGSPASAAPAAPGSTGPSNASAEQLQEMYDKSGPYAGAVRGGEVAMTLNDVIVKTGICFVFLLAGAFVGWQTAFTAPWLFLVAMLVGFGLGLANAFKKRVSPPLVLAYALVQGVFLGAISNWFNTSFAVNKGLQQNLALQAVIGTLVAFGVMLALYTSKIIKVNGTFTKMMLVAMGSYLVIAVISLGSALFGFGGGWGFYGAGPLGIVLCLVGVALASFSLCLDFESIAQAVRYGVPERESWRMAFGLLATLIWLYLEILRLLAIIASNR